MGWQAKCTDTKILRFDFTKARDRATCREIAGRENRQPIRLSVSGRTSFAQRNAPPKNQSALVVLPRSLDVAKERVVLDPNVLDPKGRTTIDFYKASYDGKHVIVSLSKNGARSARRICTRSRPGSDWLTSSRTSRTRRPAAASSGRRTTLGFTTRVIRSRPSVPKPTDTSTRRCGFTKSVRR